MKDLLIVIDGPAGAGKTTISRALADRLGYRYVDTGALYRGVAFEATAVGVNPDDDEGLNRLCKTLVLEFRSIDAGLRLISNNADITDRIRSPEISMMASAVSARSVVRKYLLDIQREMGRQKGVVFEGRDMGTVVFPDADVKFFLDASIDIRARRRFVEIGSKTAKTIDKIRKDVERRDKNDSTRTLAPLKPAEDAIIIDSTDLTIEGVVEAMLSHIGKRLHG